MKTPPSAHFLAGSLLFSLPPGLPAAEPSAAPRQFKAFRTADRTKTFRRVLDAVRKILGGPQVK